MKTPSASLSRHSRMHDLVVGMLVLWLASLLSTPAFAQDYEVSKGSVVKITSISEDVRRTGTGFVVKVDGEDVYIVTASHVVEGDRSPQVAFLARRNTAVKAQVLKLEGGDPRGMALLLVHGRDNFPKGLRALLLDQGNSLSGGQDVAVIGFGQGQGDWAVIRASVTSLDGRDIKIEGRVEEGNSGGPLLKNGRVAGLVTGVRQGFGIATPALIVGAVLRGWGVELSAVPSTSAPSESAESEVAAPPAATAGRYLLQPKAVKAGRRTREEIHFDLSNGLLVVALAGQQVNGRWGVTQRQVIDHEVIAVSAGQASKIKMNFATMSSNVTRELGGEKASDNNHNTLQGKTVTGTRNGLRWDFKPAAGTLSAAELRDLQTYVVGDEDGFPKAPVDVGQQWEIVGQPLRNLLKMDDFSVSEGKAQMRFERVVPCAGLQCAEVAITLSLSGIVLNPDGTQSLVGFEAVGRLLRVLESDLNVEMQLNGQMVMRGQITESGIQMDVTMSGPFIYNGKVTIR